jgi:hypothetical protein
MKIVFFDCDWFDPYHGTQENNFGMVDVKHARQLRGCNPFVLGHQVEQVYSMSYTCEKLGAWWVVYRLNPREWLHTLDDSGYHENQVPVGEVDEVYQDDELSCSFNINPDLALNFLCGNANDVTLPEQRKQTLRKTKKHKILNILYISIISARINMAKRWCDTMGRGSTGERQTSTQWLCMLAEGERAMDGESLISF